MTKTLSAVWKKLEKVLDPEINISVVDLGLIYQVKEKDGRVKIKMTLTTVGCPLFDLIEKDVKDEVSKIKGVKNVKVELTFQPPWTKKRLSKKAKLKLGLI